MRTSISIGSAYYNGEDWDQLVEYTKAADKMGVDQAWSAEAWGQDAVTYVLVSSVFLYFAVTQARRSHLRVSLGPDLMERAGLHKTILVIRALISAMSVALFCFLAYFGIPAYERSMMMERTTQSMVIQIWPFQFALIVAFALLAIVCLFQFYQDVRAIFGKKVFEWAPVEEGIEI